MYASPGPGHGSIHYRKIILGRSTEWAYPIIRGVLESGTCGYAVIRVPFCWIIYITAKITYIFLHTQYLLCISRQVSADTLIRLGCCFSDACRYKPVAALKS